MNPPRIYLDHAATTPMQPEALAAMQPWLSGGNPSSLHTEGRKAKDAIDTAREAVSGRFGALFAEVVFTSGGTESANLAILGTALANPDPNRNVVLMGATEHHCVLHTAPMLSRMGYEVQLLPVDREGRIDRSMMRLDSRVLLVCAMNANNELGSVQEVRALADAAHASGSLLFCDAVQTFGKEVAGKKWQVDDLEADLVSASAHKIGGPRGAGALYVRAGTGIKPLVAGGGQERELRGGTENTAAIVGFGVASNLAGENRQTSRARDRFMEALKGAGAVQTVTTGTTLSGHAHVRFPGVSAETLLIRLDRNGVSASSGAACSSGSIEPSHVLLACGYNHTESKEGVRFTFGPNDDVALAEEAAERVIAAVRAIAGRA